MGKIKLYVKRHEKSCITIWFAISEPQPLRDETLTYIFTITYEDFKTTNEKKVEKKNSEPILAIFLLCRLRQSSYKPW